MFDGGQYQGIAGSVQGLGGFGADAQSQGAAMQPGAQQQTQQSHLGMNPAQFAAMSQMGPDLSSAAGNGLTPAMLAMLQQQTQQQQQGGASGSRWPAGQGFNPSMFSQAAQQAPSAQSGAPSYASQPAYNFGALQGGGGLGSETGGGMFGQAAQTAGMPYAQFTGASAMPQSGGAIEPTALMNGMNGFADTSNDGAGSSYGSMPHAGSASANGAMQPFMYASASSPGASDVGEFKKPGTSQGGRISRGTPTSTPGPKFGAPGAQQASSPGHAMPHAGGVQAFARDRSRSHTRSPSVSGAQLPQQPGHRPPGTPLQAQQPHPASAGTPHGAHAPQPQMALPNFPPGWQPAMPPAQQQQMMGQAMQLSKQRASQGQALSPSQALQQMGFVFVKSALLPPQAQEALVAGGAVISISEARALGFLPQHAQSHAAHGAGAAQTPAAHSPHPSSLNPQAQQQQQFMMQQQQQHARTQSQQPQQQHFPSHAPSTPQQQAGMPPPQVFRPSPGAHAASPAHGPQSPGGMSAPNGSARARQGTNPPRPQSRSSARGGSRPPTTDGLPGSNPFAPAVGSDVLESASRRPSSALTLDSAPPGPSRSFSVASTDGVSGGPPDALAAIEQQAQAQAAQLRAHRFSVASLPPSQGGPLPKFTKSGFAVADYNSRVTPLPALPDGDEVPEEDAKALEKLWQPLTKDEEGHLAVIMQRDHDYTQMINTHGHRSLNALRARADELRPAPQNLHWWERPDVADDAHYINKAYEALHVLLPQQKRHEQLRKGGRSAGTLASNLSAYEDRRLSRAAAGQVEDLVPIRLEIDFEAWRLRETFTWNASDAHVGLDSFALTLCEDFGLPPSGFVAAIKQSVQAQVQEHVAARALYVRRAEDAKALRGTLDAEGRQWWKRQRDSLVDDASHSSRKRALSAEADDALATTKRESSVAVARPRAELRIDIRLDITVGAFNLVDRFEWDLAEDESTSPEQFAEVFAADLGLSGEFRTAIAHSIREQVDVHKRSLALLGYAFDGAEVYDEELRTCFLPSVSGAARNEADADSHTPRLHQLSEADIDLLEKERERDARRKRRQTRGRRGITLPDREPQKTQRTPAVAGLQAANIAALLASNGETAGGGEWNGLGPGGRSDRGAGISTRRAAAAATASIAPSLGLPDQGTPAPAPEAPQAAAKRARLESHAVHFVHPGGLGGFDGLVEAAGPSFVGANGGELHKPGRPSAQTGAAGLVSAQDTPQLQLSAKAAAAAALAAKHRAEDAKTQHECWHDGVWHCSNCGIPGTLAPGRRKGPMGDKTLCGPCGKYYHRHRRIQSVHYTRDVGFHRGLYGQSKIPQADLGDSTQPTSAADTPASGANGSSGARAERRRAEREVRRQAGEIPHSSSDDDDEDDDEDDDDEPVDDKSKVARHAQGLQAGSLVSQPQSTRGNSPDLPFQQVGSPDEDSDSDSSPGSSRRPSASPSKNGVQARLSQTPVVQAGSPLKQEQGVAQDTHRVTSETPALAPPSTQQAPAVAPEWLSEAADSLRQQYPDDRFELLLRARPAAAASLPEVPGQTDWRVRCQDCPGKLYTPGPGESLANFLIHLRNRLHRNNVAARLSLEQ